jgi:PhnB protein
MQLANYLFFTTDCEAALAFYTACGLGQITELKRYGADGMFVASEAMRGKILHARFEGPGILFFASDNHDAEPMRGSAHYLTMRGPDATDSLFAKLGEGGTVTTPLAIQPWGGYYGKLTDRFGVQWMLECPDQKLHTGL